LWHTAVSRELLVHRLHQACDEARLMNRRSLVAGVVGGALAILGPALVRALADDRSEQIALSLMIAGPVMLAALFGFRRS
jgi:hypothetical protein